jgi:hypothetical protein
MTLTHEQQQVWMALQGAPYHAHRMAQDIAAVKGRGKRFHQRVDQHLGTVLRLYKGDEVIRIICTWLTAYQLPLDPSQLENFDQFHTLYGGQVLTRVNAGQEIAGY